MCNLYTLKGDIFGWAEAHEKFLGTVLPIQGGPQALSNRTWKAPFYPDYEAPILRNTADGGREVGFARWGMPSSSQAIFEAASSRADKARAKGKTISEEEFRELLRLEPDKGTTNIRNTISPKTGKTNKHWAPWLEVANRCVVPFTSFAEPDQDHEKTRKNVWFALDDSEPLAYFAGVWTPHACVRMKSKGWEELEVYGFLTTDSAEPVKTFHKKAMPVILTTPAEVETWLSAPWEDAKELQRPLPDNTLKVISPAAP